MEMLAIPWICGSSAWARPTAAISPPMLSCPSTANQPANPVTAATNMPVTTPEPTWNLPSSPALRLAPPGSPGLPAGTGGRLGLGAHPLDHPVAGDEVRGPPHRGGQQPLYSRMSRESRSLSTPIGHTTTGAPTSTSDPEQPVHGQQRDGDEADGRDPRDRHGRSRTPLARRPTSLVMTETTSPSGARAVAVDGVQHAGREGGPEPVLQHLHRMAFSRFESLAAAVNAT